MDIFYRILWYEDQKDWYDSVKGKVKKLVEEFSLIPIIDYYKTPNLNDDIIKNMNYDLILVDYNLTNKKDGVNGDKVIEFIREGKIYTDVIFYSENDRNLIDIFNKKGLEGVFVSRRSKDAFISKIRDITYKNLKRSLNPINLRGIVMDNTSEFDTEMKEITLRTWNLLSEENKLEIDRYIKKDLLKDSVEDLNRTYEKYINDEKLVIYEVIEDRIFDSSKKSRLLNKIMSLDEEFCKELNQIFKKLSASKDNFYKNYCDEIIKYRNALAHAKKTERENDIYIGKYDGTDIRFDKDLCNKVRKNLIKYNNIFNELYKYIEEK